MGTPTCQKLHCHLFVKLFSHTGKIMVFFPQGKGTLPAGTVKILFSLIYRAAAKRADANLFPRMESLQFFLRYFFTSLHDSFYKFCNPFQKLFAIKLPSFYQKQAVLPFCCHGGRFQIRWNHCRQCFSIHCWKYLFSFAEGITGRHQLFDNSSSCGRCAKPFFSVSASNSLFPAVSIAINRVSSVNAFGGDVKCLSASACIRENSIPSCRFSSNNSSLFVSVSSSPDFSGMP